MKVAIYARTSTQKQEYDRQIDALKKYCATNKHEIIGIYEEKLSGKIDDRPEFQKLCSLSKNEVDMVLVWEFSRLGRNAIVTQSVIKDFTEKGIDVFIYNQDLHTLKDGKENPYTKMLVAIMSTWAESEAEYIKERMESGRDFAVNNRGGNIRRVPFGYKSVDRRLEINEPEAKIVREVFKLALDGMSYYSICVYLNTHGITKPQKNFGSGKINGDGKWRTEGVKLILKNPIYMGYFSNNKWQKVDGKKVLVSEGGIFREEAAIVSREVFEETQRVLEKRCARSQSSIVQDFLLRGLVICPTCGTIMSKGRSGQFGAYKCPQFRNKMARRPCMTSPQLSVKKLDAACWEAVRLYCIEKFSEDAKRESIESLQKQAEEIDSLMIGISIEIGKLTDEAAAIAETATNILLKFPSMKELYTKEINKIERLNKEIERLNTEGRVYEKKRAAIESDIRRISSATQLTDTEGIDKAKYIRTIVKNIRPYGTGYHCVVIIELITGICIVCGYFANRKYYILFHPNTTDNYIDEKFYPQCYFDEERRVGIIGEKEYTDYLEFLDDVIEYHKTYYNMDIVKYYTPQIKSIPAKYVD